MVSRILGPINSTYNYYTTGKPTLKIFVNQEAEREQEKTKKLKNANELFEEQIMQHVSTSVAIQPRKKNTPTPYLPLNYVFFFC